MHWQRRTRTPIGLDVGSGGLRAAQLTRRGDHFTMTAFAGHSRAAGLADQDIDTQASLLRRALRTSPFRGHEIWAALDPPALEFLTLELPTAILNDPDTDLDEVTRWEVERMIGESASDVETRYWTLPTSDVPGPNTIAVAAKRDHVLNTLAICRSVGWACTRVDAGAAALARFGHLLHPWNDNDIWGLLDIGLNESRVMLCAGDEPVLVRRAGPGGDAWTQRIAEALGVSANAAETHKRDHGIALTRRSAPRDDSDNEPSELAPILLGALRSDLREIASEVKRSYEYVLSRYPDRHAADLVLVGGSSALKNLPEFLCGALGIPVRRASEYIGQTGCRLTTGGHHPFTLELLAKAVGAAIPG